jgi:hypothetical protein
VVVQGARQEQQRRCRLLCEADEGSEAVRGLEEGGPSVVVDGRSWVRLGRPATECGWSASSPYLPPRLSPIDLFPPFPLSPFSSGSFYDFPSTSSTPSTVARFPSFSTHYKPVPGSRRWQRLRKSSGGGTSEGRNEGVEVWTAEEAPFVHGTEYLCPSLRGWSSVQLTSVADRRRR